MTELDDIREELAEARERVEIMPRHGPKGNPHNLPRRPRRAMPAPARPVRRRVARPAVAPVRRRSR